jgi:(R,R)-butanediol dehydrogenase/meso-butanediol dehydrogenase/diacetyl reductase
MAYARDFEPVLRLMAEGRYPSQRWTEVIPLDDVVERGFVALHHQRAGKILVDPSAVPAIVRT